MKRAFKLLSVIVLLPLSSFAQRNYKPGFVVTIKGDTLKGYIDYRGWDLNPTKIRFQPLTNYKPIKFSVSDITSFEIYKIAKYQRYIGMISMDDASAEHMIEYRDTSFKVDTVFLEVLQKGKNVALYSYSDAKKERFFIGDTPDYYPVELGYRLYYDPGHSNPVTGQGRTVNENTYMKQLLALAAKYNALYDSLQRDIEQSDYKPVYLVHIVKMINEAAGMPGATKK